MGRLSRISLAQSLSNAADRYAREYIEIAAGRDGDSCLLTVSNPYDDEMREAAKKAGTGRGFRIARTFVVSGLHGSMEVDDKEGLFTVEYQIPKRTILLN